jgi:hypothetical protein
MRKIIIFMFTLTLMVILLVSCGETTRSNTAQISPMSLSSSQQEVLDLITRPGQEILLFDYTLGGVLNQIEVWIEVYNYGELIEEAVSFKVLGDQTVPLENGQLTVQINQYGNNEFRWTISTAGGSNTSSPWVGENESMMNTFGTITEPVSIIDGQEIVLYVSRFTTGDSIYGGGDLQHYLEDTEILSRYTYTHIIKARFSK